MKHHLIFGILRYRLHFLFDFMCLHVHHEYLILLLQINVDNNQLGRIRLLNGLTIQPESTDKDLIL